VAVVGGLMNISTYSVGAEHGTSQYWVIAVPHLSTMALGFAVFIRIALHHVRSWTLQARARRDRLIEPTLPRTWVPRALKVATVLAWLYLVGVVASAVAVADSRTMEPSAEQRIVLRFFSAMWLAFCLTIAWADYVTAKRMRHMEKVTLEPIPWERNSRT
jgi:hypothetical protein